MTRTQLALAGLMLFCVGGLIGAALVHKSPPPVTTATHVEQDAKLDQIAKLEERKEDTSSIFRVLPEIKVTTKKTTYHKPEPKLPPFPGSPMVCYCPESAIASVEETTSETGKGSESINAGSSTEKSSAVALQATSKSVIDETMKPLQAPPESRLSLALGVSTQITDKSNLGLSGSAGLRIYEAWGLRANVDVPLNEPARASLLIERRFK